LQKLISSSATNGLKRMLDAANLRQKFILNNIANEKTPGYFARDLDFYGLIKSARNDSFLSGLRRTNNEHLLPGNIGDNSPLNLDEGFVGMFINYKNSSSQEEEMVNLASNSLAFRAAADLLSRKYRLIAIAITGGAR